jgi:hypothetical protein
MFYHISIMVHAGSQRRLTREGTYPRCDRSQGAMANALDRTFRQTQQWAPCNALRHVGDAMGRSLEPFATPISPQRRNPRPGGPVEDPLKTRPAERTLGRQRVTCP